MIIVNRSIKNNENYIFHINSILNGEASVKHYKSLENSKKLMDSSINLLEKDFIDESRYACFDVNHPEHALNTFPYSEYSDKGIDISRISKKQSDILLQLRDYCLRRQLPYTHWNNKLIYKLGISNDNIKIQQRAHKYNGQVPAFAKKSHALQITPAEWVTCTKHDTLYNSYKKKSESFNPLSYNRDIYITGANSKFEEFADNSEFLRHILFRSHDLPRVTDYIMKESRELIDVSSVNQFTIDFDWHDDDICCTPGALAQEKLYATQSLICNSPVIPTLILNSPRGIHAIYSWKNDVNPTDAKRVLAQLHFLLSQTTCLTADYNALDLNRLTRLGMTFAANQYGDFVCFPIYGNNFYYNFTKLESFLNDYVNQNKLAFETMFDSDYNYIATKNISADQFSAEAKKELQELMYYTVSAVVNKDREKQAQEHTIRGYQLKQEIIQNKLNKCNKIVSNYINNLLYLPYISPELIYRYGIDLNEFNKIIKIHKDLFVVNKSLTANEPIANKTLTYNEIKQDLLTNHINKNYSRPEDKQFTSKQYHSEKETVKRYNKYYIELLRKTLCQAYRYDRKINQEHFDIHFNKNFNKDYKIINHLYNYDLFETNYNEDFERSIFKGTLQDFVRETTCGRIMYNLVTDRDESENFEYFITNAETAVSTRKFINNEYINNINPILKYKFTEKDWYCGGNSADFPSYMKSISFDISSVFDNLKVDENLYDLQADKAFSLYDLFKPSALTQAPYNQTDNKNNAYNTIYNQFSEQERTKIARIFKGAHGYKNKCHIDLTHVVSETSNSYLNCYFDEKYMFDKNNFNDPLAARLCTAKLLKHYMYISRFIHICEFILAGNNIELSNANRYRIFRNNIILLYPFIDDLNIFDPEFQINFNEDVINIDKKYPLIEDIRSGQFTCFNIFSDLDREDIFKYQNDNNYIIDSETFIANIKYYYHIYLRNMQSRQATYSNINLNKITANPYYALNLIDKSNKINYKKIKEINYPYDTSKIFGKPIYTYFTNNDYLLQMEDDSPYEAPYAEHKADGGRIVLQSVNNPDKIIKIKKYFESRLSKVSIKTRELYFIYYTHFLENTDIPSNILFNKDLDTVNDCIYNQSSIKDIRTNDIESIPLNSTETNSTQQALVPSAMSSHNTNNNKTSNTTNNNETSNTTNDNTSNNNNNETSNNNNETEENYKISIDDLYKGVISKTTGLDLRTENYINILNEENIHHIDTYQLHVTQADLALDSALTDEANVYDPSSLNDEITVNQQLTNDINAILSEGKFNTDYKHFQFNTTTNNILNKIKSTDLKKYKTIQYQLRRFYQMINNPIDPNQLKSNILRNIFNNDITQLRKDLSYLVKILPDEADTEYPDGLPFDKTIEFFKNYIFFEDLIGKQTFGLTFSSPIYKDRHPSAALYYREDSDTEVLWHFNNNYPSLTPLNLIQYVLLSANPKKYALDNSIKAMHMLLFDSVAFLGKVFNVNIITTKPNINKTDIDNNKNDNKDTNENIDKHKGSTDKDIEQTTSSSAKKRYYKNIKNFMGIVQRRAKSINNLDKFNFQKYKQQALDVFKRIHNRSKKYNEKLLEATYNAILNLCIKNITTGKHNEANVFNVQTWITLQYLADELQINYNINVSPHTLQPYVQYLLHHGLISRQTNLCNVYGWTKLNKKRNNNHHLLNIISLVNFNIFSYSILENAQKLGKYAKTHKKSINRLNVIDITNALGYEEAKKIYPETVIFTNFKQKNEGYTASMLNQVNRYYRHADMIKNNPNLSLFLLYLKFTPNKDLTTEEQKIKEKFQTKYDNEYAYDNHIFDISSLKPYLKANSNININDINIKINTETNNSINNRANAADKNLSDSLAPKVVPSTGKNAVTYNDLMKKGYKKISNSVINFLETNNWKTDCLFNMFNNTVKTSYEKSYETNRVLDLINKKISQYANPKYTSSIFTLEELNVLKLKYLLDNI